MKLLILAALLALSTGAHADYSGAVDKQRMCSGLGRMASSVFDAKQQGVPESEVAVEIMKIMSDPGDPKPLKAIKRVFESANSRSDAYMIGWAVCMDDY